jgi:hypothetical protein
MATAPKFFGLWHQRARYIDPKQAPSEHPTTRDIAWAAGIIEGEASIVDANELRVVQKDRWLCDRLRALFGGYVTEAAHKARWNIPAGKYWVWNISGARVRGLSLSIYSFLPPRRKAQLKIQQAFTTRIPGRANKWGFPGVAFNGRESKPWKARVWIHPPHWGARSKRMLQLGSFATAKEAGDAVKRWKEENP